ncbi:YaiO family outer membrane beta-barrel protein [soil metagenome]
MTAYRTSCVILLASFTIATTAQAQTASPPPPPSRSQVVEIGVESQDYDNGYGSLRSVKLEYRLDMGDTTVTFSTAGGERRTNGTSSRALQFGGAIYHDLSPSFSTRTAAYIAEDDPVFARYDLAQDFTVRLADKTTATIGGRWAQYFGGRDVYFLSGGLRRYFRGGSIAYRATYVIAEGQKDSLSQLINLSINDASGRGKTLLWLNAGAATFDGARIDTGFSPKDFGGLVQRIQPLNRDFSLSLSAGMQSYARPAGRVTGTKLGMGLVFSVE